MDVRANREVGGTDVTKPTGDQILRCFKGHGRKLGYCCEGDGSKETSSGFFFRSISAGAVLRNDGRRAKAGARTQKSEGGPPDLEAAVGMGERRRHWALVWRTGCPSARRVA